MQNWHKRIPYYIPILTWLPQYDWRANLIRDVVVGMRVLCVHFCMLSCLKKSINSLLCTTFAPFERSVRVLFVPFVWRVWMLHSCVCVSVCLSAQNRMRKCLPIEMVVCFQTKCLIYHFFLYLFFFPPLFRHCCCYHAHSAGACVRNARTRASSSWLVHSMGKRFSIIQTHICTHTRLRKLSYTLCG